MNSVFINTLMTIAACIVCIILATIMRASIDEVILLWNKTTLASTVGIPFYLAVAIGCFKLFIGAIAYVFGLWYESFKNC